MKVKVRGGYTLFIGARAYFSGETITIDDLNSVAGQEWKIEIVPEVENYKPSNDKMIKESVNK